MKLYEVPKELEMFQPLILKMGLYDIKKLRAEFYGGGDSGQIDHIDSDPVNITQTAKVTKQEYNIETRLYDSVEKELPFKDAFESIVYEWLDTTDVDWYNNEGGGGFFEISMTPQGCNVSYDVYYNEMISNSAISDEIDLEAMQ